MLFKIIFNGFEHLKDILMSKIMKRKMRACGSNVSIHPSTSVYLGIQNLSMGNNVSIPRFSHIFCSRAPLTIGNNVIFGPAPTIVTGDHIINCIGTPMFLYKKKGPEEDLPVVIEDDVWVGANVTILKGVTIGRGSVIAAGAVVNKSTPPYSISGGIPAKTIRFRFTIDEILEHEKSLYPENKRYTHKELEKIFSETKTKK
ncbi:MAG: acyltransferase [Bacteroidaceae bacterium]|nr:acyltransferase [Bacteroidaceae bacterium]